MIKLPIFSVHDLIPYVRLLQKDPFEKLLCLSLDHKESVLGHIFIEAGSVTSITFAMSHLFTDPLKLNAKAILVVHTHPNGIVLPSVGDIQVTRHIQKAGDILGIPLKDHVIFTNTAYYSFLENGLLRQANTSFRLS